MSSEQQQQPAAPFKPIEGGCLCGAVRYVISQPPPYSLMCLCADCQKVGGGFGSAAVIALRSAVEITKGADNDQLASHQLPDNTTRRKFCKTCGSHVFAGDDAQPVVACAAGTLDDPSRYQPQVAIWCSSKAKWFDLGALPQFAQYPPPPPSAASK